jgi:hypothetical protein
MYNDNDKPLKIAFGQTSTSWKSLLNYITLSHEMVTYCLQFPQKDHNNTRKGRIK